MIQEVVVLVVIFLYRLLMLLLAKSPIELVLTRRPNLYSSYLSDRLKGFVL